MKRFFKPIEKEGSAKKPALSSDCASAVKTDGDALANGENEKEKEKKDPLKFLSWNANSLLLRIKNDWPQFSSFVQALDPDVICIQEVRIPAAGAKGTPKNPGELKDDTSASREEKQVISWTSKIHASL